MTKRFQRVFALLFIFSLFVGIAHELSHTHYDGEPCEVCIFSHVPALLVDLPTPTPIAPLAQQFDVMFLSQGLLTIISHKSRSPPLT